MKDQDGDDWGDVAPPEGVTPGSDCDDADSAVHPQTVWYRDQDADGFGDPQSSQVQCAQPEGYVLDDTDCLDGSGSGATTYPGAAPNDSATECMQDEDDDDWGNDDPPGGVAPGTDCNDQDAGIYPGVGC